MYCLMVFVVELVGLIEILMGLFIKFLVSLWILVEKVVENSRFWCFLGNNFSILWMLWIKFMLSMWFVLLSIKIFNWLNLIVFWLYRFIKWFGVVIKIFVFLYICCICGLIFILLNIIVFLSGRWWL